MVLLVVADDNAAVLGLMAEVLEDAGHRVIAVPDGLSALAAVRMHVPDLVVLDGEMPGLTGRQVSRTCAEDPAVRHIPIVLVSGSLATERAAQTLPGFMAALAKPFGAADLQQAAAAALSAAGWSPRVGAAVEEVVTSIRSRPSLHRMLEDLAAAGTDLVAGAEHAGISVIRNRNVLHTVAATDELVNTVDTAQYDAAEGPCVDAAWDRYLRRTDDLGADWRWPRFGPHAARRGIRSMLSLPLTVAGHPFGGLNLYAAVPCAFDSYAERVGTILCAHTADALASSPSPAATPHTRGSIQRAAAAIAQRGRRGEDDGFWELVRHAEDTDVTLGAAAHGIHSDTDTHQDRVL